jgi:hypothetical protein
MANDRSEVGQAAKFAGLYPILLHPSTGVGRAVQIHGASENRRNHRLSVRKLSKAMAR